MAVVDKRVVAGPDLLDDLVARIVAVRMDGDQASAERAGAILRDYFALVQEGAEFRNGDLKSLLKVVAEDPEVSLRSLYESGRQRSFGKKVLAPYLPKTRRYVG